MQINHDADNDFVLTDYDGTVMSDTQFLASIQDQFTQLTV